MEAMALYGPLKALALGDCGDVHLVPLVEDVYPYHFAGLARDAAKLPKVLARRGLVLLELARVGFIYLARGRCPEAHLNGLVAVLLPRTRGRYEIRLDLEYRHAHLRAVVLEGLGHVLLTPENRRRHARSPLSRRSRRPGGPAAAANPPCEAWAA